MVVLQNGIEDRNLEAGIDDEQQKLEHSYALLCLVLAELDSLCSIYLSVMSSNARLLSDSYNDLSDSYEVSESAWVSFL